ncbi:MAG: lysophospholipid acyltransferase family protein [Verrucomicrobiae bacterium]|nr:lysophospholipid acyltransferase family protein [Verrucomicrobiae bacterium]
MLRLLWLTLRVEFPSAFDRLNEQGGPPVIYAFWHNRMLLMPPLYAAKLFKRPAVCLVSASSDGEMIALILERFGLKAARGSSSRRGKEALFQLASEIENGLDVAITPDGPRGPCYHVRQGIVGLAQLTGARVYALSFDLDRKIHLGSWDRFIVPLPFARVRFQAEGPISMPKSETEEDFEEQRRKLEEILLRLAREDLALIQA